MTVLPVVGFPGYFVSDAGEIFSDRKSGVRKRLAASGLSKGYRMFTAVRDGKRFTRTVHKVVLEAFRGPRPAGHEARHLNGDRLDNRESNLEWATHTENIADIVTHGTRPLGSKHRGAKLTEAVVKDLREQATRLSPEQLADRYGISRGNVYFIVSRKTWRHVQP